MSVRLVGQRLHRTMSQARTVDGVFAVHKPTDVSSFDVIRNLQRRFKKSKFFEPWFEAERKRQREQTQQARSRWKKQLSEEIKLGHGGTLDPIATGVLITGVGKGTKELGGFLGCTKTYEAVILFGVATDSYDRVGKVVKRAPYEHVTREAMETALEQFRGKIMQRPSIFSALKVQGKKLYEYAREGKEPPVEIAKRPVEVSDLRVLDWYEGGTHEYKWPEEEAGENEKVFANKMFSKDAGQDTASSSATEEQQPLKRKTPPPSSETETAAVEPESTEPPTKRTKTTEGEAIAQTSTSATTNDESAPEKESAESTSSMPTTAATNDESAPEKESTESASSMPTGPGGPPAVKITMTVSSGFYVRCLAHDLGIALGSNAIMSSLVRTRQGDFDIAPENIIEYKDLEAGEDVWGPKLQGFLDKWANKENKGEEESR